MGTDLTTLKGIGPKSREWLVAVGITTVEQLDALGSVAAYRQVQAAFPARVSLNLLWSLEAALLGIDWRALNPDHKQYLLDKLNDLAPNDPD